MIVRPAVEPCRDPPRLVQDEEPRRRVPRLQLQLPESVEPPARQIAKVQRRGAVPADRLPGQHERPEVVEVVVGGRVHVVGEAGGQERFPQFRDLRDRDPFPVPERPPSFRRRERFVEQGVVHRPRHNRAFMLHGHGDAEARVAVRVIRGSVEGIDDPPVRRRGTPLGALLRQQPVVREPFPDPPEDVPFRFAVHVGHQVDLSLEVDRLLTPVTFPEDPAAPAGQLLDELQQFPVPHRAPLFPPHEPSADYNMRVAPHPEKFREGRPAQGDHMMRRSRQTVAPAALLPVPLFLVRLHEKAAKEWKPGDTVICPHCGREFPLPEKLGK